MDVYSTAFCFPSQSLARSHLPQSPSFTSTSPIDRQANTPGSPSSMTSVPLQQPPASTTGPANGRRHMHSMSASAALFPRQYSGVHDHNGSTSTRSHPHLSRPASLASFKEHPSSSSLRSVPSYSDAVAKPTRSNALSVDLGNPTSLRSAGFDLFSLSSESSSTSSSTTSGHRTSASLGSNIAPLSGETSGSSMPGATSTNAANGAVVSPRSAKSSQQDFDMLHDTVGRIASEAMAHHHCMVSYTPLQMFNPTPTLPNEHIPSTPLSMTANYGLANTLSPLPDGKGFTMYITGNYHQVRRAKAHLHDQAPFARKCVVRVPSETVVEDSGKRLKDDLLDNMDSLSAQTGGRIVISRHGSHNEGFSTESDSIIEFAITGNYDSVEQTRFKFLVYLDILNGARLDAFYIDYKLHNAIAGRKREFLQHVEEETGVSLYVPPPYRSIFAPQAGDHYQDHDGILLTGDSYSIARAKTMLASQTTQVVTSAFTKSVAIAPNKVQWLFDERSEEVKQIMFDNGTHVQFPPAGADFCVVGVTGESTANVNRTWKQLSRIIAEHLVASVWLLPPTLAAFGTTPPLDPSQIPTILKRIAIASGADVIFKTSCFEVQGLAANVRAAVRLILDLEELDTCTIETRISFEYTVDQKEFLSGKKNGKLNKIIKDTNTKIKFENCSQYNFLVEIIGNGRNALAAWDAVDAEIPAEISFYVPDVHHKRIIGLGGKNIQAIMGPYGVFVKFSNLEEYAAQGGHAENEDNCVIRTPTRTMSHLSIVKDNILQCVPDRDKDFQNVDVHVPRRYHALLLGEKSALLKDIARKSNSLIRFPSKESGSEVIKIFGPLRHVHEAAQTLLSHVPLHAKLRVPYSEVMAQLTTRPEFLELLNSIQRRDNIQVTLHNGAPVDEDIVLDITVNMATASCLSGVVEQIVDFLQAEDVPVYPGTVPPRTEPVRDAFQFFNSAILATGSNSLSPEGSTSPTVNQKILLSARSSPPLTRPPSRPPGLNVGPGSRARDIRQPVGTPNHSAAESFAAPSGYGNLSIGSDRAAVGPSRVPFAGKFNSPPARRRQQTAPTTGTLLAPYPDMLAQGPETSILLQSFNNLNCELQSR